ncbi:MAG TPA: terminase TerL endonuclease subunit [Vicinamibacterales bacterium]|nr:terminase TerL endonuclease subunit [Vicinamibacterales bacterium]
MKKYALAVLAGAILAGPHVKAAAARHLKDLDRQQTAEFPYRYDPARAQRVFDFYEQFLVLDDGHAFTLQSWQQFIVGSVFGWVDEKGDRRFRTAYVETAKGSGKTPLAGGLALYGLIADQEPAAEVYSLGVTRDQAQYLFNYGKKMVSNSPELRELLGDGIGEHNIAWLATHSFFRPLSSEGRSLDNKRPHLALVDELHEHPSSIVVDKIRAGTKGRRQALIFEITNSGYDRNSVCWHHHDFSLKVLENVTKNETWFAYVCALDAGDDWRDEKVWPKANPNIGISITLKYLREQVAEAVGMPSKQNIVRRLNFCEWTEQAERWLDLPVWDGNAKAPVDVEALRGRACYLGLDLSSTRDLSALLLLFPSEDGDYDVVAFFWLPEENMQARVDRDRVPYDVWSREGFLELTPGNVIDYERIEKKVLECVEIFDVRELGYDPWNATQLILRLEAGGVTCFPIRQGFASLTAATKELEKLVVSGRFHHGGHPVLRWNAANVAIEQDAAGNLKPSKKRSTERIDGISAAVNALDRAMRNTDNGPKWFEEHGVLSL